MKSASGDEAPSAASPEPAPFPWQLLLLPVGAAVLWLAFANRSQGLFWPDEIFQSVEQAHRLVFGYGFIPWEFQVGARSWLFPGTLAGVLAACARLGVHRPEDLVFATKAFMVFLGVGGLYASMRLAHTLAGWRAAVLAGLIGATFPPHLIFAGRAMSEIASGTALAFAAWLSCRAARGEANRLRIAGFLVVLATVMRPANGLFALGLPVMFLLDGRLKQSRRFFEGVAAGVVLAGALDWATWGAPFRSLFLHVRYNFLQGHASDYGRSPFTYYVKYLWTSTGISLLVVAAGMFAAPRRRSPAATTLAVITLLYLLLHMVVPHKELRFVMPVMPILFALAAVGLERFITALATRVPRLRAEILMAVIGIPLALLMATRAPHLSYAQMGQARGKALAGQLGDGFNQLLMQLNEIPDVCGVALAGIDIIWVGGYTYLHRNVPFIELERATMDGSPSANYLLAPAKWNRIPSPIATRVARVGEAVLYRYERACAPPPPKFERFELPNAFAAP